ncbi:MAG TPA: hypothetical protein VFZ65_00910 [Planctomycetota bacterium]|nr:hypothetical protein [Planctomycetota bacterium]
MSPLPSDLSRLDVLLTRLQDLERCEPKPHERAIVEVARGALREELSALTHRLGDTDYWRGQPGARRAC